MNPIKLKNGLTLFLDEDTRFNTVSISYIIKSGAFDETGYNKGIAHLIEHIIIKSKNNICSDNFSYIDNIGGEYSAETYFNRTRLSINVVKQNYFKALKLLTESVFSLIIDPKIIELEKSIIKEEIYEINDNPKSSIIIKLNDVMHKKNINRQCILGTVESINKITYDEIVKFLTEHYNSENILIYINGNINSSEIIDYLSSSSVIRKSPLKDICYKSVREENLNFNITKLSRSDLEQSIIGWGISIKDYSIKDYYILELIDSLLFGGMSSRFYKNLREEEALIYDIYTYNNYMETDAIIIGSISTTNEVYNLIDYIWKQYEDLSLNLVSEDELKKAKMHAQGQFLRILDDIEQKNFLFSELIAANMYLDYKIDEKILDISANDILKFAIRNFNKKNICFMIIGKD